MAIIRLARASSSYPIDHSNPFFVTGISQIIGARRADMAVDAHPVLFWHPFCYVLLVTARIQFLSRGSSTKRFFCLTGVRFPGHMFPVSVLLV